MKKIIVLLLTFTCVFSLLLLSGCNGNIPDNTTAIYTKNSSRFDTARHVVEAAISDLTVINENNNLNSNIRSAAVAVDKNTKVYVDVQSEDGTVQIVLQNLVGIKTELLKIENLEFDTNYNEKFTQLLEIAPEKIYCAVIKESDTKASIIFCYETISGDNNLIKQIWKFTNYVDSEENFHTKSEVYWTQSDNYFEVDIMKNDERCICEMGYTSEGGYQYSYSFADKNGKYISVQPAQAAYVYKDSNGGLYYFNNKYNNPNNPAKTYTYFNADESLILNKDVNGESKTYRYAYYSLTGVTDTDENLKEWSESGKTNSVPGHNNQSSVTLTAKVYETTSDTLPGGITFPQADFVAALEQKVEPALNNIENLCEIVILTSQKVSASKAALSEYLVNISSNSN